jgi:hypothetical protein
VVTLTTPSNPALRRTCRDSVPTRRRAGIEWALYTAQRPVAAPYGGVTGLPASYSFQLPGATLAGFTVTVSCSTPSVALTANPGDTTGGHILITSTACNQPDAAGTVKSGSGTGLRAARITAQL